MSRLALLLVLILFCVSLVCDAGELTVTELIHGVNEAQHAIQSGELVVRVTVVFPREKSEEEIDRWIQEEKEREREAFRRDGVLDATHSSINFAEFEETYLVPYLDFQANWYRQRTDIEKCNVAFQLQESDAAFYPYKMTIEEQPGLSLESIEAQHHQAGNFYILAYDTQSQVREHIGSIVFPAPLFSSIRLASSAYYAGYRPFESFGRSSVPVTAKHLGKEVVDGVMCDVLAYETETKRHIRIWVDPSKDFCIRRAEARETLNPLVIVYLGEYQQFRRFGDVWYPVITQITQAHKDGTGKKVTIVEVIDAEFNVNFSKDFFKIDRNFYDGHGQGVLDIDAPQLGQSPTTPRTEEENLLLLCGPQSLLRICEILKVKTNLRELKKLSNFNPNSGTTMLGLKEAATYKGLAPTGVKASLTLLKRKKVPLPAIAYVEGNHFLVFEAVNKKGVDISDPAQKYSQHLTWDELSNIWEGELLIFDKKKARRAKQKQIPLAFTETPEYDFGKALGGSEIKHTFTLKNIGQKPLKILSVTETCACTASVLSRDEIPAGGTGNISAVLTVPSGNTQVEESLLVLTNDPTQSTLTLMLKGQAFIPLTTFPERLALGNQKPLQEPLAKRVSLHVQSEVQILGVRTNSAHLQATLKTAGKIPHVEVQVLPSIPVSQFSYNLLIDYKYQGQQTTHDVLVFGEVLGELQITPKRLFLGLIKEPSTVSKHITISSRNNHPFKISSVESSSKTVVATVKKTTDETRYQLTTTINPKAAHGEFSGEIVVQTSSSVQPTLRVPFFGILADAN